MCLDGIVMQQCMCVVLVEVVIFVNDELQVWKVVQVLFGCDMLVDVLVFKIDGCSVYFYWYECVVYCLVVVWFIECYCIIDVIVVGDCKVEVENFGVEDLWCDVCWVISDIQGVVCIIVEFI